MDHYEVDTSQSLSPPVSIWLGLGKLGVGFGVGIG